jgi:hypothetical protein
MKTKLCTATRENVQFRMQRQVVKLEDKYITLSMNRVLKYSNGSDVPMKFQSTVHTCVERMEVGWTTGSSANE